MAIRDAAKMLIPTIGVVDSNCNPNRVTYPIPGNDDSMISFHFYADLFRKAINMGKQKRARDLEELERMENAS